MAFTRNTATNLLPTMFGLFMEIGGTSNRVISTISNAGGSVSVTTIERMKRALSDDARRHAIALLKSPHPQVIVFDNVNLYLRKAQQRLMNSNEMIHATNAAVISLPNVHPLAFHLPMKLANRGKRNHATGEDVIPTAADDEHMLSSFEGVVVQLIATYCPGSELWIDKEEMLKQGDLTIPRDRPLPVSKTDTRPLGLFDVNEGSKRGIITMLERLQEVSTLGKGEWSGTTRIIAGDWLTSSNLRAARRDRTDDINGMERLEYAEEISQLFHFALNAAHMILRLHFGNAVLDPGSLARHKGLLNRTWDAAKPNYADGKALIRHSLTARILYSLM